MDRLMLDKNEQPDKTTYPVLFEGQELPGGYKAIRRLGRGRFAVIWLMKDSESERNVAVKLFRFGGEATARACAEARALLTLSGRNADGQQAAAVRLLDSFVHVNQGRKHPGKKHFCLVLDLAGVTIGHMIDRYAPEGVRWPVVKWIARQMAQTLAFMHDECGYVHGDIKPENICIARSDLNRDLDPLELELPPIKATAARVLEDQPGGVPKIGAGPVLSKSAKKRLRQKRAKARAKAEAEGVPYVEEEAEAEDGGDEEQAGGEGAAAAAAAAAADGPAAAAQASAKPRVRKTVEDFSTLDAQLETLETNFRICLIDFDSAFPKGGQPIEQMPARPYRAPETILGGPVTPASDMWALGCVIFELATADFMFSPRDQQKWDRDADHLAQLCQFFGPYPKNLAEKCSEYRKFFNNKHQLKKIPDEIVQFDLHDMLVQKYHFKKAKADEFVPFIQALMNYNPAKRMTAKQLLECDFLKEPMSVGELRPLDLTWESQAFAVRELDEHFEELRATDMGKQEEFSETQIRLSKLIEGGLQFNGQFQPVYRVGHGAFSDVFFGRDTKDGNKPVAIKVEVKMLYDDALLENEMVAYETMSGSPGFPTIYWTGKQDGYNAMAMEFLGVSTKQRRYTVEAALKLAYQLTEALESLHTKGYLHNDLKPGNIVFRDQDSVCIVDLGLASKWREDDGKHIAWFENGAMVGNPKFASINNHKGTALSRRDDLEAMGYCFMEYLRGNVPWHGVHRNSLARDRVTSFIPIRDVKAKSPEEQMFAGYPAQFVTYLKYVKALKFDEDPDYGMLKALFKDCLEKEFNKSLDEVKYVWKWRVPPPILVELQAAGLAPEPLRPSKKEEKEMARAMAGKGKGKR